MGLQRPSQLPLAYPLIAKDVANTPPILVFDCKPIALTKSSLASYFARGECARSREGFDSVAGGARGTQFELPSGGFFAANRDRMAVRMAYATNDDGVKPEIIAELRTKLHDRCEKLTPQDLDHAVGLGRGYLVNQMPTLPMILGLGKFCRTMPTISCNLQHYWKTTFGFDWNADSVLTDMKAVSLADLKKLLIQLIDESDVRIY